jgi:hypothetical protein
MFPAYYRSASSWMGLGPWSSTPVPYAYVGSNGGVDLAGIKKVHEIAGAALVTWMKARDLTLSTHTGYVAALKAWKAARDATENARSVVQSWLDKLSGDPSTDPSWFTTLVPYRDNDVAVLADLATGKAAVVSDLAAHFQLGIVQPAAPPPVVPTGPGTVPFPMPTLPGSTKIPFPMPDFPPGTSSPPTVSQKPDGSVTVTDSGGSVDIAPNGDVTTSAGIPTWAWLVGLAALVYGVSRYVL